MDFLSPMLAFSCKKISVLSLVFTHMKLRKILTANRRISNKKFRMMKYGIAALSLYKIDRIHYLMFDVGRSMFDVRRSSVSYLI